MGGDVASPDRGRLRRRSADDDVQVDGPLDLVRVAADLGAALAQDGVPAARLGRRAEGVPKSA
jgi:hypothetical protein